MLVEHPKPLLGWLACTVGFMISSSKKCSWIESAEIWRYSSSRVIQVSISKKYLSYLSFLKIDFSAMAPRIFRASFKGSVRGLTSVTSNKRTIAQRTNIAISGTKRILKLSHFNPLKKFCCRKGNLILMRIYCTSFSLFDEKIFWYWFYTAFNFEIIISFRMCGLNLWPIR